MPTTHPFPKAEAIRELLGDLLGRSVTVVAGDPLVLEPETAAVMADYRDDDGGVGAMCITDLRLSNALGAALTMVAPTAVEQAVKSGQVDAQNLENLSEIVKVAARLFNHEDFAPLRWHEVQTTTSELPDATNAFVREPAARRDYDVTVDEYGAGKLAILVG